VHQEEGLLPCTEVPEDVRVRELDEDGGEQGGDEDEIQRCRDEEIDQISPSRTSGSRRIALGRSETQGVG